MADGHATELPYMFPKHNSGLNAADFSQGEKQLSYDLIQYWGAFVKTGQPKAKGLADWPSYDAGHKAMSLRLAGKSALISEEEYAKEHNCAFWDSLPGRAAS